MTLTAFGLASCLTSLNMLQLRSDDRGEFGFIFEEWNSLSVYTTEMFFLHITTHFKTILIMHLTFLKFKDKKNS